VRGCSKRHWKAAKKWVMENRGPRCAYCRRKVTRANATIDHIVPFSRGGTNHLDNLAFACLQCNLLKGNMLPEEFKAAMHAFFGRLIWIAAWRNKFVNTDRKD